MSLGGDDDDDENLICDGVGLIMDRILQHAAVLAAGIQTYVTGCSVVSFNILSLFNHHP